MTLPHAAAVQPKAMLDVAARQRGGQQAEF
jgi:hypothetical protein